jgi:hypothetical protein
MPVLTFSPKQGLYEKRHRQEQIVSLVPNRKDKIAISPVKEKSKHLSSFSVLGEIQRKRR